mgnify:CR=1 FL=1
MNDCLPEQTYIWQFLEEKIKKVLDSYCYKEIRFPIVEKTALFTRSIGEVTDIVEKEMYTFEDRNGESLSLRPEGTAGCVRACIENGLLHNQQQKLWYKGQMFRYEKPQKGRYRQFNQIGIETYGIADADADAEVILLSADFWRTIGLTDVELQINSLGDEQSRAKYREVLVEYFRNSYELLDEDSKRRLEKNPLRILDSKNPEMADLVKNAPNLLEYLDEESERHFQRVQEYLNAAGISYVVNPRLVRGLDYYNRTVFEWVTTKLGAQGTVCAGGRYDGLVEQIGGRATPAVGFAIGVERIIALLEVCGVEISSKLPNVYIVSLGDKGQEQAFSVSSILRNEIDGITIMQNSGGGSFKSQFKKADKSGAGIALVIGEDEVEKGIVGLKYLREKREQETVSVSEIVSRMRELI